MILKRNIMENEIKIIIYDKVYTREELHKMEEEFRKSRAKLSFEEKIKILVDLQKLAFNLSKKKEIIIWKL